MPISQRRKLKLCPVKSLAQYHVFVNSQARIQVQVGLTPKPGLLLLCTSRRRERVFFTPALISGAVTSGGKMKKRQILQTIMGLANNPSWRIVASALGTPSGLWRSGKWPESVGCSLPGPSSMSLSPLPNVLLHTVGFGCSGQGCWTWR